MTTEDMTIDELARRAGMTVRNVRAHQTRGLIPPPSLHGRTGVYGPEHLARLQLIREMQDAGFNLTGIKKLLNRIPEGAGEEALRFEQALLSPWTTEEPEVVSAAELIARFGYADPELLARAQELGIVRLLDDGLVEVPVPSLLRAGQQVLALGVPLEEVLAVTEVLVASAQQVAAAFTELFLRNVWRPFEQAGRPADRWPDIRAALEGLRPLASEALLGAFQATMDGAVEQALGTELHHPDAS